MSLPHGDTWEWPEAARVSPGFPARFPDRPYPNGVHNAKFFFSSMRSVLPDKVGQPTLVDFVSTTPVVKAFLSLASDTRHSSCRSLKCDYRPTPSCPAGRRKHLIVSR
ncbi:hypothetical protein FA13DRAFT_361569 [Coprinellus micaceus]|uniref:Uncharacterized protein n=1 Tax=Coprinellus micaceus TaxID=71717 RepID=A0A4Y7TCP9_COPMI|nr:hypothetical protein FA13DRAFT_361569 [Coprinellus micaceus]